MTLKALAQLISLAEDIVNSSALASMNAGHAEIQFIIKGAAATVSLPLVRRTI